MIFKTKLLKPNKNKFYIKRVMKRGLRRFSKSFFHSSRRFFSSIKINNNKMTDVIVDNYYKPHRFTTEAYRSLSVPNAGGDSVISEMYSIDKLQRSLGLMNSECILEKEVKYWVDFKMVDYILKTKYRSIGVSVTRLMTYNTLNYSRAINLLTKKIVALDSAKKCVVDKHDFKEKIVHVWCKTNDDANLLSKAAENLCWDGIIWITIADLVEIYEKTQ